MTVHTFRDFTFRAQHHIPSKFGVAAMPHWHTYCVRFFFAGSPDQDKLSRQLEQRYAQMHGASLNSVLTKESTDEDLAKWFLDDVQAIAKCVRVVVENDFQRGSEVSI